MDLHLNDSVHVQLTEEGRRVYEQWFDDLAMETGMPRTTFVHALSCTVEGEWQEMTLWRLMHIFGPSLMNGRVSPFMHNVVRTKEVRSGSRQE